MTLQNHQKVLILLVNFHVAYLRNVVKNIRLASAVKNAPINSLISILHHNLNLYQNFPLV